jgi:hypothetical protein
LTQKLPKPRYAAPCNGCGLCCRLEVCRPGRIALREAGHVETVAPCPFIVKREGMSRCALVLAEQVAIERGEVDEGLISRALAIGWGCTMEDEDSEAA